MIYSPDICSPCANRVHGKVSCLQATYGRYADVARSLACFLRQDYHNRELVILNNHPVPMVIDHPLVRIVNEPGHPTLGHCRQRLLDFADGEFCRTWDDDDLYAPWSLSQGVANIGDSPAFKPTRSWWRNGPNDYALTANAMEASILWRTDFVRRIGYRLGQGDEHKPLLDVLGNAGPKQIDFGEWASYVYSWGCGGYHASGTIGNGQADEVRAVAWQRNNEDVRPGVPLVPNYDGMLDCWRRLVRRLPAEMQTVWMRAVTGAGLPYAPPAKPILLRNSSTGTQPWECYGEWRYAGRLVAAPGCWDLLHAGHVDTLRWAKTQGDVLAVLVNDDAGVTEQKGPARPLVPLAGRVASLAALDFVDAVFVVPGRDDMPLLEWLKPAVAVKGPEYAGRVDSVPRPKWCDVRISDARVTPLHTSDLVRWPAMAGV